MKFARYGQLAKRTHLPWARVINTRDDASLRPDLPHVKSWPTTTERWPSPSDLATGSTRHFGANAGVMHISHRRIPRDDTTQHDAAERRAGRLQVDYCPPVLSQRRKKKRRPTLDKSRRSRKRERNINVSVRLVQIERLCNVGFHT